MAYRGNYFLYGLYIAMGSFIWTIIKFLFDHWQGGWIMEIARCLFVGAFVEGVLYSLDRARR